MKFSCAGSATKLDEIVNSFRVYHVERFDQIYMEEYVASSAARVYRFTLAPRVLLE